MVRSVRRGATIGWWWVTIDEQGPAAVVRMGRLAEQLRGMLA